MTRLKKTSRTLKTFVFVVLPLSGAVASAEGYFGPAQAAAKQAPKPAASQNVGFDVAALDKSIEPCTDFYQFACGGWMKANPIPADQSSWGRANEIDERNQQILKTILENAAAHP